MRLAICTVFACLSFVFSEYACAQFEATARVDRTKSEELASGHLSVEKKSAEESFEETLVAMPLIRLERSGMRTKPLRFSVRGTQTNHSLVLLDGLLLSTADGAPFDLSMLPKAAIERLSLFAFGTPGRFNVSPIGGTLSLSVANADPDTISYRISTGAGSYGYYELEAGVRLKQGKWSFSSAHDLSGSSDDFSYVDDRGTRFNANDDRKVRRMNADFIRQRHLARLEYKIAKGQRLSLVLAHFDLKGGEAGPANIAAKFARSHRQWSGIGLNYRLDSERTRISASLFAQRNQDELYDPKGEISFYGKHRGRQSVNVNAHLHGAFDVLDFFELSTGFDASQTWLDNTFGSRQNSPSRSALNGNLEARLHGEIHDIELEVRGTASASYQHISGASSANDSLWLESGKLAFGMRFIRGLALFGSWSGGNRAPSLLERFGDQAMILGNPKLREESGDSLAVGINGDLSKGEVSFSYYAALHRTTMNDLIRFRFNSQNLAIADNQKKANGFGADLHLRLKYNESASIFGHLSYLDLQDERDLNVPLRPAWKTGAGFDLAFTAKPFFSRIHIGMRMFYRGRYFQDPANYIEMEDRLWADINVMFELDQSWHLRVSARDIFDQGGADILGYPLPGRTYFVSLLHQGKY